MPTLTELKVGSQVKVGYPYITNPNRTAKVIGETPTMWKVEITGFIFDKKTSGTGVTHKFTKERREFYLEGFKPYTKNYYKSNLREVGGDTTLYK